MSSRGLQAPLNQFRAVLRCGFSDLGVKFHPSYLSKGETCYVCLSLNFSFDLSSHSFSSLHFKTQALPPHPTPTLFQRLRKRK